MLRLLFLAFAVAAGSRLPESARRPPNIPDNDNRRTVSLTQNQPSSLDSLTSPAAVVVREPGVSTISLQLAGDQTFPQPPVAQEDSLPTITVGGRVFSNSNRVFRVPVEQKVIRQKFQPRVSFQPQRSEKVREEVKPLPVLISTRQPALTSGSSREEARNEESFQPYSFQYEVADDEEQVANPPESPINHLFPFLGLPCTPGGGRCFW